MQISGIQVSGLDSGLGWNVTSRAFEGLTVSGLCSDGFILNVTFDVRNSVECLEEFLSIDEQMSLLSKHSYKLLYLYIGRRTTGIIYRPILL